MWLLLVPACLAIFSSSLTSASEPHYVITVPVNLQQGTEEKACVTFLDLKEEVDLKIELKKDDQIHTITECKISTHDHSECYSFQVPLIKEDNSVWQLHVSAHGEHINVDESKNVVIVKKSDVCIVQTDKSTYKPGDIVKFRVMSVNHEFLPLNKKYPLVEIKDTNKNRIAQWLDVSTEQGFADFIFHLAPELNFGEYKINIPNGCEKYFNVDKYVLKRWELKINAPSDVFLAEKSFHLEVCGRYIYGKPVEGTIDLSVCLEQLPIFGYYHSEEEEEEEEKKKENPHKCIIIKAEKTDSKGCVSRDIQLDTLKSPPSSKDHVSYLDIDTELTEDGTGHSEEASLDLFLNPVDKTITFLERESVYHKGFPFHGKVQVTENKKPLANEAITISTIELEDDSEVTSVHVVTDSNGIAKFAFNTSEWDEYLALRARLTSHVPSEDDASSYLFQRIPQDWLWISAFYSESDSLLSVQKHPEEVSCHSEQSLMVDYNIHKKNLDSDTDHLHFFYIFLTRSGIFSYKEHKVDIKDQENSQHIHGSFPLKFHVDDDFFPTFNVLFFSVLPNGETIAHTTTFNVSPCAQSKVKLSFSEEQVRPGEDVNLEVTADAGSWCSVRSVDKGYLLVKPHDDHSLLTEVTETLRNAIQSNQHAHLSGDPEERQCPENTTMEYDYRTDVFSLFERNQLKIITNAHIKAQLKCRAHDFAQRSYTLKKSEKKDNLEKEIQKRFPRRYFPDTWLYELVPVGSDGHTVLNRTTPDSITKWSTDAVCLGKSGFGSVKDVELTTFQRYFIDLIVPYSVVQGEKFTIQAVVFSYANKCSLIVASLSDSEDLITVKDKDQARCVCEGHSHSFTWDVSAIKPKTLKIQVHSGSLEVEGDCNQDALLIGKDQRKDSIEKTIVVKPKGYEEEKAQTFLLLPSDKREDIAINIKTPERLVPGSERAHLIIQGDIMANIAVNLDDIFRMPEGCGEQNAAKMLRIANALDYLESIHELTPEQKAKSIEFLVEGYQKQLTLRTENGSYAMFSGEHENIWLTAFVINALSGAQKHIYINENHIQQAVKWLHSKQLPDGCFRIEEDYFNNYIDEEGHILFTAFFTVALLEHHVVYNGSIVEDALNCLRKTIENATSEHNLAILAYIFTLSGDSELRDQILKKLDEKAIKEGDLTHWESSHYQNTQTASFVILALLSEKIVTIKTLEDCVNIIRWILTQQTAWGGFGSSQDTTITLHALAKYAKAVNHKKGDATVTIHSKSGFQKIVHIDKSNSFLVQTVDLPEIPGEYTASVTGNGLVYLQSHVHYHATPEKKENEPFSFSVSTHPSTCTHASQKRFDVHVDVRYSGKRENTNMVLILLQHVSGYVPDKDSVKKLEKNPLVERTEVTNQNISIYLSKLTSEPVSFNFTMEQEAHVEHLQPAIAAILDYYDPDENNVVEYTPPCVSAVAHCAVAPAERQDCGFSGVSKDLCEQRGCCFDSSTPGTKWCFFQVFRKTEEA